MADVAVLTGDIVRSSALGGAELDAVFADLACGAAAVEALQGFPPRLTRFRGDGWQMVCAPGRALRCALLMRAAVRRGGKGRDTRLSLAIGPVDPLPVTLGGASGAAFVASGRGLETLRGRHRMVVDGAPALAVAIPLADAIASGWTPAQAAVVFEMLRQPGRTQEAIAEKLGHSQQDIQKKATAAGFWAIEAAISQAEMIVN